MIFGPENFSATAAENFNYLLERSVLTYSPGFGIMKLWKSESLDCLKVGRPLCLGP